MYELLNIQIKDGKQLVNGRDLHGFLEVNSNYTTWFNRMCEYGFANGKDFIPIMEESNGGRPSVNHAITLDMAKHISMIQRNEKGMMARNYFIQCENLTRQLTIYYDQKLAAITDRLERTEKLIGVRSKTVFNYGKYIKNKMGIERANKDYENVKMVLFAELDVAMWEEIDYSLDVIAKIDEVLEVLRLDKQMSLF